MRQYLWMMPVGLMPGSALAWAIVSPIQLAVARMTASRALRILVALGALVVYVLLASAFAAAWLREPFSPVDLLGMSVASAYLVFGFAIPWFFITERSLRDTSEKWWQASLLGAGVVVAGAIVWIIFGSLIGAQTD